MSLQYRLCRRDYVKGLGEAAVDYPGGSNMKKALQWQKQRLGEGCALKMEDGPRTKNAVPLEAEKDLKMDSPLGASGERAAQLTLAQLC